MNNEFVEYCSSFVNYIDHMSYSDLKSFIDYYDFQISFFNRQRDLFISEVNRRDNIYVGKGNILKHK